MPAPREARSKTAASHAARMTRARRALAAARRALARDTVPGSGDVVVEREWAPFKRAMDAHRDALLAYPGVVGVGIGCRRRAGRTAAARCVIVYVAAKRDRDDLLRTAPAVLLPRTLSVPGARRAKKGARRRVPLDVVELGDFTHHLDAGESVGTAGTTLHGTITAFAKDGSETVALTAMHVTGLATFPPGPAVRLQAPHGGPLLGTLTHGSTNGIDGARIALSPSVVPSREIAGIGRVHGWRPLAAQGDRGTFVRMAGAASGGVTFGRIIEPVVALPGAPYFLDTAILVDIQSVPGDSGAAIVDNDGLVLGLLVGRANAFGAAVFCPIGNVLFVLGCDIPTG